MLSSLQGSDIKNNPKGTFSEEPGGMIKAYNNSITGGKGVIYAQDNKTQFDAYLASSRDEKVPASYKTVSGGTTYNNFDTSSEMYSYSSDDPKDVADIVTKYAGRTNGGDFKWTFTNKDDESHTLNSELMAKIKSYKSDLVSVGGNSVVNSDEDIETPVLPDVPVEPEIPGTSEVPSNPETPEEPIETEVPTEPEMPEVTESIVQDFTKNGKESDYFDIKGNLGTDKVGMTYEGEKLTKYLKLETSTEINFETEDDKTLTLILSPDFSKDVVIDGKEYKASNGVITVELEGGSHTIKKGDAAKLYFISIK